MSVATAGCCGHAEEEAADDDAAVAVLAVSKSKKADHDDEDLDAAFKQAAAFVKSDAAKKQAS